MADDGGGVDTSDDSESGAVELGIQGYQGAVEVGRGGFGAVYRAYQPKFHRTVAIKVLSGAGVDARTRERFERERTAMGSLSAQPNIMTVYDAGFTDYGHPFIVMEYTPAGSLADLRSRRGSFTAGEAVSIGVRLATALATAHKVGILHRDVKPENIMVSPYGEPLLSDFGIARMMSGPATRSGVVTASLDHAAPEVLEGKTPAEASDVYSLASTIYALAAGTSPFRVETDESLAPMITRILTSEIEPLPEDVLPATVFAELRRAMSKSPIERHGSALQFADALRSAAQVAGLTIGPVLLDTPVEAPGTESPAELPDRRTYVYERIQRVPDTKADEPDTSRDSDADRTPPESPEHDEVSEADNVDDIEKQGSNRRLLVIAGATGLLLFGTLMALAMRGQDADPAATPTTHLTTTSSTSTSTTSTSTTIAVLILAGFQTEEVTSEGATVRRSWEVEDSTVRATIEVANETLSQISDHVFEVFPAFLGVGPDDVEIQDAEQLPAYYFNDVAVRFTFVLEPEETLTIVYSFEIDPDRLENPDFSRLLRSELEEAMTVFLESPPPTLTIITPVNGSSTTLASVTIRGTAEPGNTVQILTTEVTADDNRNWEMDVSLAQGTNQLDITATDPVTAKTSSHRITITRTSAPSGPGTIGTPPPPANRPPTVNSFSRDRLSTGGSNFFCPLQLGNASDPDGDPVFLTHVSQPTPAGSGTAKLDSDTGSHLEPCSPGGQTGVIYTWPAGWVGTATMTFTVSDNKGGTATATMTVHVKNSPPTAQLATYSVSTTRVWAKVCVLQRASDPDGDPLTLVSVSTPSPSGIASIDGPAQGQANCPQTVRYEWVPGFTGEATMTWTVSDGRGGTASARLIVTVTN